MSDASLSADELQALVRHHCERAAACFARADNMIDVGATACGLSQRAAGRHHLQQAEKFAALLRGLSA